jgi:hypothetical protein
MEVSSARKEATTSCGARFHCFAVGFEGMMVSMLDLVVVCG